MNEGKTVVAIVRGVDLSTEEHGRLMLQARFDTGGLSYGLGYTVDADFIQRFMGACGRESLLACEGRNVLVTAGPDGGALGHIAPMPFNTGEPFDITAWCARKRAANLDELIAVRASLGSLDYAFHQINRQWFEAHMAKARTTVGALILREEGSV